MKKVCFFLAATLLLTVASFAQAGDTPFQLNYYSNRNNSAQADQFLRIINDGASGSPISNDEGRLCADIYVFDSNQEMIECCHCPITANGLRTISVLNDLTANPLTGSPAPDAGVIKILTTANTACSETNPAVLATGLIAWQTHIEQPLTGTFVTAVNKYANGTLSAAEYNFLGQACSFVQYLGSGKGVCTCGTGS